MVDLAKSQNILLENDMEIFSQICRYLTAAIMDAAILMPEISNWHALSSKIGWKKNNCVSQELDVLAFSSIVS